MTPAQGLALGASIFETILKCIAEGLSITETIKHVQSKAAAFAQVNADVDAAARGEGLKP